MGRNKLLIILVALLVCAGAVGVYSYCNVDMTGEPYADIAAFREAYPNRNVSYTVTITGNVPVELNESSSSAQLTASHMDSLLAQKEYLQGLTEISFPGEVLTAATMLELQAAFPNAAVDCGQIQALGSSYPYNTTIVDLSDLTADQAEEAGVLLQALPKLETVELCKGDGASPLSLDLASMLHSYRTDVFFNYRTKLFGQVLSTDMERIEYFKANIYDEGLSQFRLLLPMMHNLTYLRLDWCGTSNEAMARLRDDYADRVKVVWRVFFGGGFNALTDTLKIWIAPGINDSNNTALQYCTDVKYMDIGHNVITHCEWVRYMPDLEVLIMAETNVSSLEPLRACKKLEFLEIFNSRVTDLSPLADLTNLEYLNISELAISDISPIYHLDKMKHVNSLRNNIPDEQVETYKQLQPQCESYFFSHGNPTKYNWRRDRDGHQTPRYKLLYKQIGYKGNDYSRYPGGYLTEEMTYESTGIDPNPGSTYKIWKN